MIYIELSFYRFQDAFSDMNRADNFTYEALKELYDYYDNIGEDIELDVIAICCDWNEMSEEECRRAYNIDEDEDVDSYLNSNTTYYALSNGNYLFQVF
ncbi:MAG: hypothetical protein ACK5X3_11095 [Pseudomonadota bacterium]|jgi:hypothetical protein